MSDKKCLQCGLWSTRSATLCDCGYDFGKGISETPLHKPVPFIEKVKNAFYLIGCGAIFGATAIVLLLAGIWFVVFGGVKSASFLPEFLTAAFSVSILIGLPAGGIGGLLGGNLRKHKTDAVIGGIGVAWVSLVGT